MKTMTLLLRMRWLLLLCVVVLAVAACNKDDNDGPKGDNEATEEDPLTDAMKVTTTIASAIVSTNGHGADKQDARFISCLENRLTAKSTINSDTRIVFIYGNHLANIDATLLGKIQEVYDKGACIVVILPTGRDLEPFMDKLNHKISILVDAEENPDEHFCDVYIFNNHGKSLLLHDVFDEDPQDQTHHSVIGKIEKEGDAPVIEETIRETNGAVTHGEISQYRCGLLADEIIEWIAKYALYNPNDPILANAASNRVHLLATGTENEVANLADMQLATFKYWPTIPSNITDAIGKGSDKKASCTVHYYYYPLYSFNQQKDYYLIHQEIIANNGDLNFGKWSSGDWYYYAAYLNQFNAQSYIRDERGNELSGITDITNIAPGTTTGSASFTTGTSMNFGGQVGVASGNPTATLNAGVSWSDSWTTSIPDLAITNKCISDGDNAYWEYTVAWPHVESDYLNTANKRVKIDNVAAVGSNTIVLNNTWVWTVEQAEGSNRQFTVQSSIAPLFGYTRAEQSWIGSLSWESHASGHWYKGSFNLEVPNRVRPQP